LSGAVAVGTLDGKIAIVTGAARGVGRGIALALGRAGAKVAIADLLPADEVIAQLGAGNAVASHCDIRSSANVNEFVAGVVDRFGAVDILVNNAIATAIAPIAEIDDEGIELSLSTGPAATLYFMRACYPHLVDGGRVINLRSGTESQGLRGHAAYIAAKAAIGGITRVAAREWGRAGITVNAICPFALSEGAEQEFAARPGMLDGVLRQLSIPRSGDPEHDIGRAVVFLAAPESGYITGCTLMVDGGGSFLA
jgi:NAD(P)-dependent dehydrogenase (short-subunit alcohol dehydrogenase family)